jgi:alkylated DNA repair dioxygenase AlkB
MSKRTIESFYKTVSPPSKKIKADEERIPTTFTTHASYPHPIADLPPSIANALATINSESTSPKIINNQPHLDLLYFHPLIPQAAARDLFQFLRRELPFYRVQYSIRRGGINTQINTPRFTTVFGLDATSQFITPLDASSASSTSAVKAETGGEPAKENSNNSIIVDAKTQNPVPKSKYQYTPRPIPACLEMLRHAVERSINDGSTYNFCLVNYYATGDDSISYHSDDERFLGPNPSIASISLGAQRDFLMKHKPADAPRVGSNQPMKFALAGGDMVVMRGETQANWLHSIPKRKGGEAHRGRINITFRKAVVPGGTNNYYNYNVGVGAVYRWDEGLGKMCPVVKEEKS